MGFVVMPDLPAVMIFQPVETSVLVEADLIGIGRDGRIEGLMDSLGQGRAVNDKAQFRVQVGRAGVEIEGADKDTLSIDGKGLGMQAGARAAEGAGAFVALQVRRQATHLVRLYARAQQVLAPLGVA